MYKFDVPMTKPKQGVSSFGKISKLLDQISRFKRERNRERELVKQLRLQLQAHYHNDFVETCKLAMEDYKSQVSEANQKTHEMSQQRDKYEGKWRKVLEKRKQIKEKHLEELKKVKTARRIERSRGKAVREQRDGMESYLKKILQEPTSSPEIRALAEAALKLK